MAPTRRNRLSIRIDVDVTHARAALSAAGAAPERLVDPLSLAATVEAIRVRLHDSLVSSYPGALITVVAQHGRFTARPTRCQQTRHKPLVPSGDAECVHVAEHADALRAAAVHAVAQGSQWAGHAAALDAAAAAADVRLWGQPQPHQSRQSRQQTADGGESYRQHSALS